MKYHNQPVKIDGRIFDSKKEGRRYEDLYLLSLAGEIRDLRCQVKFELLPKMAGKYRNERAVTYIADFTYYDKNGEFHVEDVKSEATRKNKEYVIKRKLMLYRKGISVEEI